MCRLFGMLSTEPTDAHRYLLDDPCSIYNQSRSDPRRLQGDGWGLGFYVDGTPRLVKSEKPIYTELGRFTSVIEPLSSRLILAHIRRASNPRGLPRERIISAECSQPFMYGRYIFVHNGSINIPDEVMEVLGKWRSRVEGLNDSEVYFWFLMREMEENGVGLPEAIRRFQSTLSDLWEDCRDRHPDKDSPYSILNIILTDGERIYAYTGYDEERYGSVKSLCFGDQPCFEMSYVHTPEKLVVSSEKTNRNEDWQPLRNGHLLTGEVIDGTVRVDIQRV
ncbi:hypothetical protein DRO55_00280 [Candidatus Bathyarchaeota archaeon]|nr:MAG: hypothetical protein DRO55_00280 [Candidatus Bathyarchaeota archaeon]